MKVCEEEEGAVKEKKMEETTVWMPEFVDMLNKL